MLLLGSDVNMKGQNDLWLKAEEQMQSFDSPPPSSPADEDLSAGAPETENVRALSLRMTAGFSLGAERRASAGPSTHHPELHPADEDLSRGPRKLKNVRGPFRSG